MLQAIRDKATGWIAWAIIILISIPFALWGINEYFSPDANVAVATVDGEPIDYRELQQAMGQARRQLAASVGSGLDEDFVRQQALDSLIDRRVLLQKAFAGGMAVGDSQVATAVRGQQMFQDANGAFSQSVYESLLGRQGMTPTGYEQSLRIDLLVGQLRQGVMNTAVVPAAVRRATAEQRLQTRTIRTLRFDVDTGSEETVTDEELTAWFADNTERFRSPPLVSFEYLELDREAMTADVAVDEASLRATYERDKEGFTQPEQRSISHILVETDDDASDEDVEAARVKAAQARADIDGGADFAEVAKATSDDIGSAEEGGSLGTVGAGVFDAAFDKVAFSGEQGSISEPVRTPFGWHIIRVDEVRPASVRSFEDMREELATTARQNEADSVFYEQLDRLANLGFENPDSLEPAATALALEIRKSGFVSRAGTDADNERVEGTATRSPVLRAAFDDVREEGNVSDIIEIGDTGVVLLRVLERRAAADRPFEAVKEEAREALLAERRFNRTRDAGLAALAALRAGTAPEEVAAGAELEWSESREATRRDPELGGIVAETVFAMPAPDGDDARVYDAVAPGAGAFVVVELAAVDVSAVEAIEGTGDGAEGRLLSRLLARSIGNAELNAYAVALREAAEVTVVDESSIGGGYGGAAHSGGGM